MPDPVQPPEPGQVTDTAASAQTTMQRVMWETASETARDLWCRPDGPFDEFHDWKRRFLRRRVCKRCGYRRSW